jgi:hypothetical protein
MTRHDSSRVVDNRSGSGGVLSLEQIARYSLEQGLTPRLIPLEEVFAASTMDM